MLLVSKTRSGKYRILSTDCPLLSGENPQIVRFVKKEHKKAEHLRDTTLKASVSRLCKNLLFSDTNDRHLYLCRSSKFHKKSFILELTISGPDYVQF